MKRYSVREHSLQTAGTRPLHASHRTASRCAPHLASTAGRGRVFFRQTRFLLVLDPVTVLRLQNHSPSAAIGTGGGGGGRPVLQQLDCDAPGVCAPAA